MAVFSTKALEANDEPASLSIKEFPLELNGVTYETYFKQPTQYINQCLMSVWKYMEQLDPNNITGELEVAAVIGICDKDSGIRLYIDQNKPFNNTQRKIIIDTARMLSKKMTPDHSVKLALFLQDHYGLKLVRDGVESGQAGDVRTEESVKNSERTDNSNS